MEVSRMHFTARSLGTLPLALALLPALFAAPTLAQYSKKILVEITSLDFVPKTVRAKVGDTIVFINKDVAAHTVTQAPGGWDSGTRSRIPTTSRSWSP